MESIAPDKVVSGNQKVSLPIQEFGAKHAHIDVSFCVRQRGQDHWIQVGFEALQPTDGFRFVIHCEEPLVIKEEATFIYGASTTKEPPDVTGCGRAAISCNQWIDQGAGVSVVIAVPHQIDQAVLEVLDSRSHEGRLRPQTAEWKELGARAPSEATANSLDLLEAAPPGISAEGESPKRSGSREDENVSRLDDA